MSKESALAKITGVPNPVVNPSLITGEMTSPAPDQPTDVIPEVKEADSTRFAHLAKKEAEIQKQREEIKREKSEFEAQKATALQIKKEYDLFKEMMGKDKIMALKQLGLSDTDLINLMSDVTAEKPPAEQAKAAAQEVIKEFQDAQAAKEAENQKALNESTLKRFREDITKTVTADKEKYEYCNYNGALAEELIYDYVAEVLKTDGEIIPLSEAADAVEQFYEEQDKAMATLKKRQPKDAAPTEPVKDEPLKAQVSPRTPPPRNQPPGAKTLTNKMTASTAAASKPANESPTQKRERLMNALRNGRL